MATDSVMGLFQDPQQYQQQQYQQVLDRNIRLAQLDPFERANAMIGTGAYQLAGAVGGALGGQDPQLQMATLRQQVLQGLDPNDSAAINKAAQALSQAGDQQGAMQLAQRALEIRNVESQISGRTEEKQAQRETQLQIAREKIAAQLEAAKERGATQLQIAQMAQEGRMQLAAIAQGTKQTAADEKAAAADQQRVGAVASFNDALTTLDVLKTHPGKSAAVGFGGGAASMVPGTNAYGFGKQLETFKAQTFIPMVSALKGMGALSDAEGKKLTDSVGALDQGMKPAEFDAQVTAIEKKLKAAKTRAETMVKDKALLKPFEQTGTPEAPKATRRWNPQTNSFEAI
jgi:hypothetical protein